MSGIVVGWSWRWEGARGGGGGAIRGVAGGAGAQRVRKVPLAQNKLKFEPRCDLLQQQSMQVRGEAALRPSFLVHGEEFSMLGSVAGQPWMEHTFKFVRTVVLLGFPPSKYRCCVTGVLEAVDAPGPPSRALPTRLRLTSSAAF